MSIKGFTVDGQDYQYNYPNLDNIPEITPEAIGAVSQEDFTAFEEEVESQIEQNKDDISALKSESYNLIDPTGITPYQTTAAAELTRTGFVIRNTTAATYSRGYLYLNLKPNTDYTFSAKKHTTSGVAYVGYSEAPAEGEPFPPANIPLISRTAPDDEKISKTFTTTTGILVIRFYAAWDTAELGEVEYSEIMVVEGTDAKPFVRHVYAQDDRARNAINDPQTGLDQKAGILRNTASGAIVSFMPDASVKKLLGLTVAVEPVQAGSGEPSPENIRPISGMTGLSVYDDPKYGGTVAWNQVMENGNFVSTTGWASVRGKGSVSNNEYTYTVTELGGGGAQNRIEHGVNILNNHVIYSVFEINPSKATKTQTFFSKTGGGYQLVGGNVDATANVWNKIGSIVKASDDFTSFRTGFSAGTDSDTFIVNDTVRYRNIMCIDLTIMFGSAIADYIYSLESGTAGAGVAWFRKLFPKDYYPYDNSYTATCVSAVNGDPYWKKDILWQTEAGTVYGAEINLAAQKMRVKKVEADAGAATWTRYDGTSGYAFYTYLSLAKEGVKDSAPDFAMSNYKPVNTISRITFANEGAENTACHARDSRGIYVKDSRYTDAVAFKESMAGQQIVYELETPIVYDLAPQMIETIKGQINNVWADAGDVTVEFAEDIKTYIDKKFAELQALALENNG